MTSSLFPDHSVTASATGYLCDVLVLGIGNLLWADEGFGVRAVGNLHEHWQFPPRVRLMDGGTQGLYLLPYVEGCQRLLILDAVDYALPPATIRIVENSDVPAFMGAKKMSLHQTGFQEVLSLALLRGWEPEHIVLVGMQPKVLDDYGGSLTDPVKQQFPEAIHIALDVLHRWGVHPVARTSPPGEEESIAFHSLDIHTYEAGRPAADQACRSGDERFL